MSVTANLDLQIVRAFGVWPSSYATLSLFRFIYELADKDPLTF
jgi:hypothetical protein